ncbi:MAG: TonB-dependent receptor plug domain-containing protein, partial [Gammaproteobacteria bacterium]
MIRRQTVTLVVTLLLVALCVTFSTFSLVAVAADDPDPEATDARNPTQKKEQAQKNDRATGEEVTTLPEMTVTGEGWEETSYTVPNATTATKTDTPIMETPFSVQVVPQQVLQDQQVFRLEKALQNVSGVIQFPANQN